MTVVLDCNILVMCLSSKSPYHFIYKSLIEGKFQIVVSTEILLEYEEIIEKKYSVATSKALIALLTELPNVLLVQPFYKWNLILIDPDDNKYCDCAVVGKANFIITEDRHFNVLESIAFPSLKSIGIEKFTNLLKNL